MSLFKNWGDCFQKVEGFSIGGGEEREEEEELLGRGKRERLDCGTFMLSKDLC